MEDGSATAAARAGPTARLLRPTPQCDARAALSRAHRRKAARRKENARAPWCTLTRIEQAAQNGGENGRDRRVGGELGRVP